MAKKNKPLFEECVLVPLEDYEKQCNKQGLVEQEQEVYEIPPRDIVKSNIFSSREKILDSNLPSSLKMKLYDQHRKTGFAETKQVTSLSNLPQIQNLVRKLPSINTHPFLNDIVYDFLQKNMANISWDPITYEIILKNKKIQKSNIIRALEYLIKPEMFNYIEPIGSEELKNAFIEIGVPISWFSNNEEIIFPSSRKEDFHSKRGEFQDENIETERKHKTQDLSPVKSDSADEEFHDSRGFFGQENRKMKDEFSDDSKTSVSNSSKPVQLRRSSRKRKPSKKWDPFDIK